MERTVSAPGKLFLAGEFAVLWGGEARLVAVGPRAHAQVRGRDDRRVHVLLDSGRLSGDATPAGVRWSTPVTDEFKFVATAIDLAYRLSGVEGPGFSAAFEPSPLVNGHKLGIGSSARAAVLAVEVARSALSATWDALKLALLAHADAQGGKGSGGDVASSFAGGVVRYRRFDASALLTAAARGGLVAAVEQSQPVHLARMGEPVFPLIYAFSGKAASTTGLVREVERRLDVEGRKRFVDRSDAHSEALEHGLLRRDFEAVKSASGALQALLWELEVTRTDELERILGIARTFGCGGKQSGAGGGDGAILFAPDEATATQLIDSLQARDFVAFRVNPERGLQGEATRAGALSDWLDAID